MVFQTTKRIADAFVDYNLDPMIYDNERMSAVDVNINMDNGRRVLIRFITDVDGGDNANRIIIRMFDFADKVPTGREELAYAVCNEMNNKFEYVKFMLNRRREIYAASWLPDSVNNSCLGQCCYELLWRLLKIASLSEPVFAMISNDGAGRKQPMRESGIENAIRRYHLKTDAQEKQ